MRFYSTVVILLAFNLAISAQGSFRIYDAQMNDITNGILIVSDTNSSMMQVNLTVENVDSLSHVVTAGRLVLTQPATASNAFTWGLINYPPSADSSVNPVAMPIGNMQSFEGYYFPNGNNGSATINYCFWETTDQSNYSCVTVTFNNVISTGIPETEEGEISIFPNPASEGIGFGWSHITVTAINVYSAQGVLVCTLDPAVNGTEIDLTNWPEGLYFYQLVSDSDYVSGGSFLHMNQK